MNKPAKITILCEDLQQACFVRRFLMKRGWTRYDLYEKIAPAGLGSGEQWVRERFPLELRAYRGQCNHLRNGLVVVIDADTQQVVDRVRAFDQSCRNQNVNAKQSNERVLYVVPRRNIETWLAYLRGQTVEEETAYPKYDCQSRCHPDADRLDRMCQDGRLEGEPPPSLERCCTEFQAFLCLIQ